MLCYASSATEEAISAGVLHGRPFGGVAIFFKLACALVYNYVKIVDLLL